jgi:hypothetical protein
MKNKTPEIDAELKVPFGPFYQLYPLPIGTKCVITNEEADRYAVKFPDVIGYSGTFHVKKYQVMMLDS